MASGSSAGRQPYDEEAASSRPLEVGVGHSASASGDQSGSPIKQTGNSEEDSAKGRKKAPKFGSRGYVTGDYRRKVFLDCMACESETSEIHRTCCDKVYCRLCAASCCEQNEHSIYTRFLSSTNPKIIPFPEQFIVPEPYLPPPFPYYFHGMAALESMKDSNKERITHEFINLREKEINIKEARRIVHYYSFVNKEQVHSGVHRTTSGQP